MTTVDISDGSFTAKAMDRIIELEQQLASEKSARLKAEAACASLCDCLDATVSLLLERANSNLLHLHEGESDNRLPVGLSAGDSSQKETVPTMPTIEGQGERAKNRSETAEGKTLASEKRTEPGEVSEVHSELPEASPGKVSSGLQEARSLQGKVQDRSAQCGCVGEGKETEEMRDVRLEGSASWASFRLQQAIRRAMALRYLSRQEASNILNSISTDCGKGWLSPDKARLAREALEAAEEMIRTEHLRVSYCVTYEQIYRALAALKEEK